MRITALIDDVAAAGYEAEHGLSLYIECGKEKIVFDFGASAAFMRNAAISGADISAADYAILSHDHYDHGGGLESFFAANPKAEVYAAQEIFGERYSRGGRKYAGLDRRLKERFRDRFVYVGESVKPGENAEIVSLRKEDIHYPVRGEGLCTLTASGLVRDDFEHERYLMLREGEKLVLVSGCSHKGILNIVNKFRPDVVIGGFHINGEADDEEGNARITRLAEALEATGAAYYTEHCTGMRAYGLMKEIMASRLTYLAAGDTVTI